MITINRSSVKKIIQENQSKPKPRLIISISKATHVPSPSSKESPAITDDDMVWVDKRTISPRLVEDAQRFMKRQLNGKLSEQVWDEYNHLRIEQGKVANKIHALIESNAGKQELKDLYESVESLRPDLIALYQRAKHVDQYGVLPAEEKTTALVSVDIYSLKDRKRKLIDIRNKLKKRIEKATATNPSTVPELQLELDKANVEYRMVDEEIKKIEGKL